MRDPPSTTGIQIERPEVLIATLGTQPQVVTLVLDLLFEQGCNIDEVVVIHTDATQSKIKAAFHRLDREFPGRTRYAYYDRACTYRTVELRLGKRPIKVTRTEREAGAVYTTLYREVRAYKTVGKRVHLNIAGGQKSMSVYGMATAQLLFDTDDCLWYLLSRPVFEESEKMHAARPEDTQLVNIPVLSYGPFASLLTTDDPFQAIQWQRNMIDQERMYRRQDFVEEQLTKAEQAVVEELLRQLLVEQRQPTYDSVGRKVIIAPKTVEKHLSQVYKKLHDYLGVSRTDTRFGREMVVGFLSPYYEDIFRTGSG